MEIIASHIIYVLLTFAAGVVTGWSTYFAYTRARNRFQNKLAEIKDSKELEI